VAAADRGELTTGSERRRRFRLPKPRPGPEPELSGRLLRCEHLPGAQELYRQVTADLYAAELRRRLARVAGKAGYGARAARDQPPSTASSITNRIAYQGLMVHATKPANEHLVALRGDPVALRGGGEDIEPPHCPESRDVGLLATPASSSRRDQKSASGMTAPEVRRKVAMTGPASRGGDRPQRLAAAARRLPCRSRIPAAAHPPSHELALAVAGEPFHPMQSRVLCYISQHNRIDILLLIVMVANMVMFERRPGRSANLEKESR